MVLISDYGTGGTIVKRTVYLEEMPEGMVIVTNEMILIGTKEVEGEDE